MARTRRPRRPRLTIGLLVLASITIITLDYRGDAHDKRDTYNLRDAQQDLGRLSDGDTHRCHRASPGAAD